MGRRAECILTTLIHWAALMNILSRQKGIIWVSFSDELHTCTMRSSSTSARPLRGATHPVFSAVICVFTHIEPHRVCLTGLSDYV